MIKYLSDVNIDGILEAIEKSFSIKHLTKPGKRLVYGVAEGPEHSVFIRGTSNGVIHLPDDWKWLINTDSITVQLTAIGKGQSLWVDAICDDRIIVKSRAKNMEFYYFVQAERKDIPKLEIEKEDV